MKHYYLLFLVSCFCQTIFSQNEASNWYFGQRAGLNFNATNGTVTAVTDGQLNTLEGCTSISDTDGNLLFYSDGRTIWNSLHQPMANADYFAGTGLLGDPSSTSSGLIVPKPQDPTKFYLFTVDEPHHQNAEVFPNQFAGNYDSGGGVPDQDDGFNNGFNYSLIDINLNGGLGDVDPLEKNVQLVTYDVNNPDEVAFKCSEKITAVKADDCSSFWVISHFTNKFYAFKVDINGVNTTPVISIVGPEVPVSGYRRNALGYIKASPDGTRLVVAHQGFATTIAGEAPGGVYLFDFDNDTGIISNEQVLFGPENGDSPYGVEFSAENRKVYATINAGAAGNGPSSVVQWDLESADIPASQVVIHTSNSFNAGALQLGINRKIYRAQVNLQSPGTSARFLGVIENPEANGTDANYNQNGILLDINGGLQNLSRIGLPPFIQSLFNSQIDIIQNGISTTELKLCTGDSYTLTAVNVPGGTYSWTKDGLPLTETTFELFVDEPGFYEVFIEPNNGECPIEGEAIVGIFEIPIANQPNNINVCDATTISSFDFTTQNADVLAAQNPAEFEVLYFTSLDDANNNLNNIIGTFNNTVNPQEIFTRVQNINNPNCFDVTSFFVEVFVSPIITTLDDVTVCDEDFGGNVIDGISTVDLSELYSDILGTQDATLYTISFHANQQDADDDANPLAENFTNTIAFTQEVFVRIENNLNDDCYSTDSFMLTINEAPIANNVTLIQCDEDGIPEGFTTFNFNQVTDDITGGATDRILSYYLSYNDAFNQEDAIDGDAFENFFNPQTIFVRVENDATDCYNISELALEVSLTSSNNASLDACDYDGVEDGFFTFDLSEADAAVLNTLPTNLDVVYYETYENALLEINPLTSNFTNTIPYNQTIFARVENSNACYGISEIELIVFELPNIDIEDETLYCLNFFPETITLTGGVIDDSPSNYYYLWSTGENTSEIMVNAPGIYTVRVTNTDGCFKDRTVTVLPSNVATITDINVVDASQNNSITVIVSGEGDYEFAIDNINGPYQDSNVFENVSPGLHTVFVRDKNDCGIVDSLVSVIGFPKFFTPNNDTFNDYWQVYGITPEFQSQSTIYIFDRYGKLLKELDPLSIGWDGTYNGYNLPSSDYWFSVRLEDGRTFKSHFALKR